MYLKGCPDQSSFLKTVKDKENLGFVQFSYCKVADTF